MKNIAIIFGGKSVEHDISIITALQAMKKFPKNYTFLPIYIKPNGKFVIGENLNDEKVYLDYENNVRKEKEIVFLLGEQSISILTGKKLKGKLKIDCALLCNHGHGGEDGSLQGLLEMCNIPYTSCGVASSAICMDKVLTKIMLVSENILTPAYVHFSQFEYENSKDEVIKNIVKKIKFPCIVKPARLGSSVGIGICENEQMLEELIGESFKFDDKIIVEKFIENAREFCCAVLTSGGAFFESKVSEIKKGKMFTFEEKYLKEKSKEKRQITKGLEGKIKKMAVLAYKVLSCEGVVRVDFLYDQEKDELFINEVNSIPGSLAFNLFDTSFSDLIDTLVCEAIKNKDKEKNILYEFNSSAIAGYINMTNNLKNKA